MNHRPLTQIAQQAAAETCRSGGRAIDATVGNGHDTVLLARCVVPDGLIAGFDIQRTALDNARQRLLEAGLVERVELHLLGHEHMREQLADDWLGNTDVVMFNLGYLPGGDKAVITQAQTTLAALDQSLMMLRPGGLLSLMLYRGHHGASDEIEAVTDWVNRHDADVDIETLQSPGPWLYLIRYRVTPS